MGSLAQVTNTSTFIPANNYQLNGVSWFDYAYSTINDPVLFKFFDECDYTGFIRAGGSDELWKLALEEPKGILPLSPSTPSNSIEKSTIAKYAQYSVRTYVDVKRRRPDVWNLVGNGEAYPTIYGEGGEVVREGCGFLYKDEGKGCLNVDKHADGLARVKLISYKCMRPQCPIDYEFWAAREAWRISERFRRVPKLSGEPDTAEGRTKLGVPIHVVVSVPEVDAELMDLVTLELKKANQYANTQQSELVKVNHFKKLAKKALKVAKKAGLRGGCMIFHPFANDALPEGGEDLPEIVVDPYSGDFDYKALKKYFDKKNEILNNSTDNELKLWYIRPHFHIIGYGWIENVEQIYAKTGYVVKNLGVRDSVFMTALYQLSHAGYREGQHTVTWVGCMANNQYHKLDPLPEAEVSEAKCPECGEELQPVRWVGEGESPLSCMNEEGVYNVDPEGWEYIPKVWVVNDWLPEGGYWRSEYRGRVVKPTEAERERRKRLLRGVAK